MKSYDVVIVNYNGKKIISSCLDSLYASTVLPSKVIIYDNNSTDGSLDLIEKEYPKVTLIKGEKNIGFGRANNAAMKYSDSEYILFMNNDLLLDDKCSEILLEELRNPEIVIVNPLIYKGWSKKSKEIYAFGATVNKSGFCYGIYDTSPDRDDLNCFSAACFMARSKTIKKIGFEEHFFLYCEEPEISVKLMKLGFKISRVAKAMCYHLESYSSPQKNTDGIAFRQFYGIQNRWFMLGKHWPLVMLPEVLAVNVLHLLYIIYFYAKNKKIGYLSLIYMAPSNLIHGFSHRDRQAAKNKYWYRYLSKTKISTYLQLGKKVFSGSN